MRATLLSTAAPIAEHPLRMVDLPDPRPGPDEMVLEVTACAVCRTDLQIVVGDVPARLLPIVPGHQVVGRVVELGSEMAGWAVGDRAGVGWLGHTCGVCRFCMTGRENLCPTARFTGWDIHGGFATRIGVKAAFAIRLPERADTDLAPLLCGGIIGFRSLRVSGIAPGGRLGLFGFGASASLAIQVALHWGCEVFVVTRSRDEQRRALALGAAWTGTYDDPVPTPLDAAITFAPVGEVVVSALRSLERGGVVAVNAIHLDRVPQFDYDLLWLERQIRSVANYTRDDAAELLRLAGEIPIVTTVDLYPLEEANLALARLEKGELGGTAVLVPT
ncbi:MAG: zinc-dependent alcohol dehydrogenase family protein [Actinobacteria bacterium]|nr:zinc-dependent alcohol dehydrogenase family protein [Actinomycetota bacterium]